MEENGYHYGYHMTSTEALGVSVGLWNFIEDYVNTHLRHERARWEACHLRLRCSHQGPVSGALNPDLKVSGTGCLLQRPLKTVLF